MRRLGFAILAALIIGCADDAERAVTNLKKGDEFLQRNEFEVAEYYYSKIPEDSPLYPQAQKKLQHIAQLRQQRLTQGRADIDTSQIVLIDHSFTTDNTGRSPVHRISMVNRTKFKLESVVVEFTYIDERGSVVGMLSEEVDTPLFPGTQDVFKNISPGVVKTTFSSCNARIVSARFEE